MPTGYTSKLYDGEQSFESFVWKCARGMGALIMMRDSDSDAPITEESVAHCYYEQRVGECERELAEWTTSTEQARSALYASWLATEARSRRDHEETRVARKARYDAALSQARAWEPPTPEHAGLRKFMIEQLELSLDFDCSVYPTSPPPTFTEWCANRTEELNRSVSRSTEERTKERERNESRLAWVRALKASVPMPVKP